MNMINQLEIQELIDKLVENGYGEIVTALLENVQTSYWGLSAICKMNCK